MGRTRAADPDAADDADTVRLVSYFEDPAKAGQTSEVQAACHRVFRTLGAVDVPVHAHLTKLGIEPQLFLLRWLRVLFSREFHLDDAMLLWRGIIIPQLCTGYSMIKQSQINERSVDDVHVHSRASLTHYRTPQFRCVDFDCRVSGSEHFHFHPNSSHAARLRRVRLSKLNRCITVVFSKVSSR